MSSEERGDASLEKNEIGGSKLYNLFFLFFFACVTFFLSRVEGSMVLKRKSDENPN